MKKICLIALFTLLLSTAAHAFGYNYISQDSMKQRLETKEPMLIVDICPAPQFAKGHLPGSIETNAYPVKTDAERAKLTPTLAMLKASSKPVVVVCPGGGGGAKRTVDYLEDNGIAKDRLLILEKGMNGWPYQVTQ